MSTDDDIDLFDETEEVSEEKNLKTILNRGKLDKFELEEFMLR